MVFNRRRKSKVKWEKQVTKARRETKDQFDRLAHDQPSAVSDLSETVFTNGSEVDAIGIFGKNDAYGRRVGDSFTLGSITEEFEPIGNYDPVTGAAYNIVQLGEESTYDNTYGESGQDSNTFPMQNEVARFTDDALTEESGFTGDRWGNQGSYRVQGLETGSDVVGQSYSQSQTQSRSGISKSQSFRRGNAETSLTADSPTEDFDESINSHRSYSNYLEDYDVPAPIRQSPIVVLYDTILSHPLLTCIAFPCIPCLALYVKTTEKTSPVALPRKRFEPRGKKKGKNRFKSTGSKDDSTFAEYHANQRRFDDISQDPESRGEIDSPRDEGRDPKLKHRIGSMNSKNSEFSEIKSKRSRKFGTRLGFKSRGGSSRVESVNVSQIQSGGRPDSRGLMSNGQTEFSNIVSQRGGYSDVSYDPDAAYDNLGNPYSLVLRSTTMDDAENLVNVPQGEWNYGSVDERSRRSNRSVGWKDTVNDHGHPPEPDSLDQRETNGWFWKNGSDTFSTHTERETFDQRNNVSLSNRGGLWNQVTDSFSVKGFGRGGNQNGGNRRMTQPMGTIDESTLGSDMHGGNPYYRQ